MRTTTRKPQRCHLSTCDIRMMSRKQIAEDRIRERRQHEEQQFMDRAARIIAGQQQQPQGQQQLPFATLPSTSHATSAAARRQFSSIVQGSTASSNTSPPRSGDDNYTSASPSQSRRAHSPGTAATGGYHRSPIEFHGDHVSFLPPHVIESLRPYYTASADATIALAAPSPRIATSTAPTSNFGEDISKPTIHAVAGAERPRPPAFVFAPKYLDSGHVPAEYNAMGVAPPVDPASLLHNNYHRDRSPVVSQFLGGHHQRPDHHHSLPFASMMDHYYPAQQQQQQQHCASSTQTNFDPNAAVSYVDISASNAMLQRRVERLEEQLEESIQQREKLGQVIKSMSYAIVPPLAFLPREFYEKNKTAVDVCADYAMLYRAALRATPSVGGDVHALDAKVNELSHEHLIDRVVMLTSEVMQLRRQLHDLEKVQQMSP